jgi:Flp pilus assembly protein TadD
VDSLSSNKHFFILILLVSEALRRAEEHADALDAKLKLSEKSREKAEKDVAAVEGLWRRLQTAEDALSKKEAQQIERENIIVMRLETQIRRFTSNMLFLSPFCFYFCLLL